MIINNVLPIINLPMTLGNLQIAAKGLLLVPISNEIWASRGGGERARVCLTNKIC